MEIIKLMGMIAATILAAALILGMIGIIVCGIGIVAMFLFSKVGYWCIPIMIGGITFVILVAIGFEELEK
jgi:hypothetical protein